jgi:hypothetical protein
MPRYIIVELIEDQVKYASDEILIKTVKNCLNVPYSRIKVDNNPTTVPERVDVINIKNEYASIYLDNQHRTEVHPIQFDMKLLCSLMNSTYCIHPTGALSQDDTLTIRRAKTFIEARGIMRDIRLRTLQQQAFSVRSEMRRIEDEEYPFESK